MGIFENLEELNVSEECFSDILSIIEELIFEKYADTHTMGDLRRTAQNAWNRQIFNYNQANRVFDSLPKYATNGSNGSLDKIKAKRNRADMLAHTNRADYPDDMTIADAQKKAQAELNKSEKSEDNLLQRRIANLGKPRKISSPPPALKKRFPKLSPIMT